MACESGGSHPGRSRQTPGTPTPRRWRCPAAIAENYCVPLDRPRPLLHRESQWLREVSLVVFPNWKTAQSSPLRCDSRTLPSLYSGGKASDSHQTSVHAATLLRWVVVWRASPAAVAETLASQLYALRGSFLDLCVAC